jgi:anti-repressor protein
LITQEVEKNIIPERDLYRLIIRSKLPEAEKFEEWVVGEVLPAIRKTGSYSVNQVFNLPTTFSEALMLAAKQAEQIEKQEKVLALQAPKVEFADQLLKSTNAIDLGTAAKAMNLGFGRNTLFQKLRDLKVLDQANRPYQKNIDSGYFTVLETSFVHPKTGDRQMTFKTLITASGQKFVLKQLKSVKS